ncbi:TonB-dependent receptor plug domain-containing protein [Pedomonas mirosovicensis]|uniref:TonB-dependent receptor plug domain-containing protein n=1 Tax=Pedomonas mirosovicensis TaxID=2908641 RepID=UPI002169A745|nr:TonB-dependent receptor [Pedomonas mirosovicensis]MCH8686733.1 TonB-dependent receptor [Pedomonas mirosovicensis]
MIRTKFVLLTAAAPMMWAASTHAQEAAPAAAPEEAAIIVTGSRLPGSDLTAAAPVTVLDRSEIDATGATNLGELLRELPVATASASDSAGRGNGGSATVALRGLSAVNTLVLINGRRVLPSSGDGIVDLNSIPFEAVERVEVLQDGASAVYGSDAIAGVVNLIMRKDFDGLMIKGGYGISSRGDLPNREVSATFGQKFDRGSFVFSGSWRKADGNLIADRPISRDPDWRSKGGRNFRDPLPTVAVVQGLPGFGDQEMILREGVGQAASTADFRAFQFPGTGQTGPNDGINYWQYETSASDIEQVNLWFNGEYDISSSVTAFVESSYNRRTSLGYLAPDYFGAVYGDPIIVSANNDYNPFGVDLSVARTIGEQPLRGRRQSNVTSNTYRIVAGLRGDIAGDWTWDLSYNHQNLDQNTFGGEGVLRDRLIQAAGDSDACRAANNGCVPINLLGGPGSITPEMLDFISADSYTRINASLDSVVGNVSGTLFALPAGDVRMAVGAEYRKDSFSVDYDPYSEINAFVARSLTPDAFPPSRKVSEVYSEIAVPILEDVPFFRQLSFDAAVRYSHYNAFGSTTNPKVGVKWRPVESLMLRGSWGTGFRAPSFTEAFGPRSRGYQTIVDPCSGPNFASLPGCGGRQAPTNTTGAFVVSGGNPDLTPEKAKNLTLGLVYTPEFLPRFSLTFDFYRITKDNVISTVSRNFILEENAANGSYADRITRNADNFAVTEIIATRENLLTQKIQGFDLGLDYTTEEGPFGRFNVRLDVTYLDSFKQPPAPGADPEERRGTYTDELGTLAKFRGTGRLTWSLDGFTASYAVRYVGPVENMGSLLVNGEHLRAGSYFQNDLVVSYLLESAKTKFTLGVENIFDKMPPFLEGNFANGFDQTTFNSRGRYFLVRVEKQF